MKPGTPTSVHMCTSILHTIHYIIYVISNSLVNTFLEPIVRLLRILFYCYKTNFIY